MKYVYRVVNALFAVGAFVAAYFSGFLRIEINLSEEVWEGIAGIVGLLSGGTKETNGVYSLVEEFSIKRCVSIYKGDDALSALFDGMKEGAFLWPEIFKPINKYIIMFIVCFVLMLVAALFILIWSIFSNKRLPILIAGALGIILDIGMMHSFKEWATPLADGTINITGWFSEQLFNNVDFLSEMVSNILAAIVGSFVNNAVLLNFALCGLQNAMLFIFIGVVVWSAIYYLVDVGDPEVKKFKDAAKEYKAAKSEVKAAEKALKELKADEGSSEKDIKKAEIALEKAKKTAEKAFAETEEGKEAELRAARKAAREKKKEAKKLEMEKSETEKAESTEE